MSNLLEQGAFGVVRRSSIQRYCTCYHRAKGKRSLIEIAGVATIPSGIGSKRAQHLRRLAKRRKGETQAQAESEETMLPLSLLQRVDVEDYDSDSAGTGTQNAATHRDSDASSSNGDSDSGDSLLPAFR